MQIRTRDKLVMAYGDPIVKLNYLLHQDDLVVQQYKCVSYLSAILRFPCLYNEWSLMEYYKLTSKFIT